ISQGHGSDYSSDLVVIGIPCSGAAIKRHTRPRRKCEAALCTIHTMCLCESAPGYAFCLTGFCPQSARAPPLHFTKMFWKTLGMPEPYRHLGRPIQGTKRFRAAMLAIDQTKMRKINATTAAVTPFAVKA